MPASNSVYIGGLVTMHISLIGTLYIIVSSIKKAILGQLSDRFPFYLALTDLMIYATALSNQIHPILYGSDWEGVTCTSLAVLLAFAVYCNMILIAIVSFQIYYCVTYHSSIDYGHNDWKLLTSVVIASAILSLPGYLIEGSSEYWCFSTSTTYAYITIGVDIALYAIVLVSFFNLRLYMKVKLAITTSSGPKSVRPQEQTVSDQTSLGFGDSSINKQAKRELRVKYKELEDRVTERCLLYILNYTLQWGLVLPALIFPSFGIRGDWIYILCNIALNLGGLLNGISFIRSEGLKEL